MFLLCFFIQYTAPAQVHITIEAPYLSTSDTLELRIWQDYIGYPYSNKHKVLTANNVQGRYYFDFNLDGLSWMDLHLQYQKEKGDPQEGIMNRYLLAPNDSLTFRLIPKETIKQSALKFYDNGLPALADNWVVVPEGRGKDKFIVKQFLDCHVEESKRVLRKMDAQSVGIMNGLSFEKLRRKVDGLIAESTELHNSEALDLLVANALGEILERISRDLRNGNYMDTNLRYLDFVTFEEQVYTQAQLNILAQSPRFLEYLYIYFLLKKKLLDSVVDNRSVYDIIKEQITHPLLRERVTIRYMMSNFNNNPSVDILQDARIWMKDPFCLDILERMAGGIKGKMVEFSLPDEQGVIHDTADLKGKIVLLDFWYMACIPCRNYMKNVLSPLAARFDGDERFSVVTISTDNREVFERALKLNDFLPKQALHLYTDDERFRHPVLKELNVQSYPQPFLLDKQGRIIGTKKELKNMDSIIELVEEYIGK